MRHTLTFPLLLLSATATLSAQWTQASPTTVPSPRRAGAMAFHPGTNRLVMYGGLTATPSQILDETWTYNGQWTLLSAPAPARWGHRMVTDAAANRLLTFGGRSPTIGGLNNDTWQFDGSQWSQIPTLNTPSARFLYGLAYDSARGVMVLFGGRDGNGASDETWEFDGSDWTQVATAHAPTPREEMGMVFDPSLNRVVLFGGCNETTQTVYGDTWWYDGADWVEVTPAVSPTPRFRFAMAFDSQRSRTVLYGGFDGTDILTDTYEYAGSEWVQIAIPGSPPSNSTETQHGYDAARGRFVIHGGFGGSFSSDTWEYDGTNNGLFTLYGQGCDIVSGTPGLSGSTPTIGQTLTLTFDNLDNYFGVVVVLGLSNQVWNGIPLPFDLSSVGLPGCNLLASADLLEIAAASNSTATYGLPIPNQTSLLALSIYTQGIVLDPTTVVLFPGATQGGRALIGN